MQLELKTENRMKFSSKFLLLIGILFIFSQNALAQTKFDVMKCFRDPQSCAQNTQPPQAKNKLNPTAEAKRKADDPITKAAVMVR